MTQNWFATFALLLWPAVSLSLFLTRSVGQATIWTILGAQLLLPVDAAVKLAPGIPQLDKISIATLSALIGIMCVTGRRLLIPNRYGLTEVLLILSAASPFVTSEFNGDPIIVGHTFLPGIGHYEALSAVVHQLLFLLPLLLGRHVLKSEADNADILRILVIAGLIYSVPILFEVRMSPQLHLWIYGYLTAFSTEIRGGGFRPVVFMGNGLIVALFIMTAAVAGAALWRTRIRVQRLSSGAVTGYLIGILLLCKAAAAMAYGACLVPLVRWTKPRLQVRVAIALAALALFYPVLRSVDVVPTKAMVELASYINLDRAKSLEFRFDQEQLLMDRASERIYFGWGRFNRSRVYGDTGDDISTTDGRWIITLGQFGLFGFLAEFGLLALPVFRAAAALRFTRSLPDGVFLAALALIVAISMIDLLPNASLSPWTWLLAGALLGRTETLSAHARKRHLKVSNSAVRAAP